jgi:diaminopimelate epimerase
VTRTLAGMEFTKSHGTANDFVVLADLDDRLDLPAELVRALCDRRRGVGADGVLRLGPADDADVFMDYRNADGSVVELCGNGIRVVAKHVVDHGLVIPAEDGTVLVGTRAGVKPVRIVGRDDDGRVTDVEVDMGPPRLDPAQVPFDAPPGLEGEDGSFPLVVDGQVLDLAVVSMGNPHAVLEVDEVDRAPVRTLGPRVEVHPAFPARTNVGFVEVVDRATVRLRVWERGVGETAACGTGACAAVVALQRQGEVDDEVAVQLPGGTLTVRWRPGGSVWMTGPAVEVARGTLDPRWVAAARRGEMEGERS